VSGAGARTALFADAASFGLVAILLFTTSGLPHVRGQVAGWFVRLRQGLGYVRERPQLRLLIAAQTVAVVFFTIVIPIDVVFAKRTFGAGDAGYGYFLASWGTACSRVASSSLRLAESRCGRCCRSAPLRLGAPT
jgi:hypothetical protein